MLANVACNMQEMSKDDWTQKRQSDGGAPNNITGTMLYSPLSVLDGGIHTVCSMLEGLYLSVLHISTDGKAANFRNPPPTIQRAKEQRLTQLLQRQDDEQFMADMLRPLLLNLRDLFYQPVPDTMRSYNVQVTPDDVRKVCKEFAPAIEVD